MRNEFPFARVITTYDPASVTAFTLSQDTSPFRRPICVEIPVGATVSVRNAVFARMKSQSGIKMNAPTAHATTVAKLCTVKGREKTPLEADTISAVAAEYIKSVVLSLVEVRTALKKPLTFSLLVSEY